MDYQDPHIDNPLSIICLPDKKVAIMELYGQFVFDQETRKYLYRIKTRKEFTSLHKKSIFFTIGDFNFAMMNNKHYWSSDFFAAPAYDTPDGNTVVISEKTDYFVCDLNGQKNPLLAQQLIEDNSDYVSSQAHPCNSIIALLTTNNYVHFFNHKTLAVIAKTKQLSCGKEIRDLIHYPRLDFDKNGTSLAVALKDTWKMIDVPQNNLVAIFMALQHLSLPKELIKHIVMNIIDSCKELYAYFDLNALINVTNIIPAPEDEEAMELETQPKRINAVYKRPPKNFCIYDDWAIHQSHRVRNGHHWELG